MTGHHGTWESPGGIDPDFSNGTRLNADGDLPPFNVGRREAAPMGGTTAGSSRPPTCEIVDKCQKHRNELQDCAREYPACGAPLIEDEISNAG